ncbi:2-octaprenyl-3-methyl-6-methoxy-1,4-benzoquinol hydroxylase [Marinobacterium lacunae]|uniref:2-octaprenyl-3-methyl-6-methoxy-1,4-benzoquinol hydroxylase n=1 Tax=Marinobacterium lacunae TaxID=1232683 RepID=A0A081FY49_9GAMM|nr:FAD-dependent monooxygenase [Marinobacterium lacunae]KEA63454.1 2-octaprenyl-3-methyl-6-methoxy-1,4-benzoquinol hydroxylase [Marinobacterium lacunae]
MASGAEGSLDKSDVVIVGGGMVGVALACALAPSGLSIRILESREGSPQALIDALPALAEQGFDPRVSALTCASQQFLTHVGAWPNMQASRVCPYTDMDVWDGRGTGAIQFSAAELHEPCLGHIVENRVTLAALYSVMLESENIRFDAGVKIESVSPPDQQGKRTIRLAGAQSLETALLVGADGAQSRIRALTGMGATEWDYGHHAIVTTIETEKPHRFTCWQRFTEDGPLALLPLADPSERKMSIVWSTSPAHARELMALEDEAFCAELGHAFEYRLGEVRACDTRFLHPLRQRHAQRYVQSGLALVGDAAHTIHPLAGQGVNLGLLDAAALAEVLLDARARGESPGDERVLRRYQRMRRAANLQTAAAMEGFRRLFDDLPAPVRLLRSGGMSLVNRMAPVKQHLMLMAMGLRGDVPRLARRGLS